MHMRATLSATLAALMSFTAAIAAPPGDSDRRQLEALAQNDDTIWDRGDARALAGLYTGDATLVMAPPVRGRLIRGLAGLSPARVRVQRRY